MVFGFHTTADEALQGIDLHGKFAIVTGGTSGLGEETARALAAAGAEVLLTARTDDRGRATVERIHAAVSGAAVCHAVMKLDSMVSVQHFAQQVLASQRRINLLINNAGIMATPFKRTEDGFESQLGVNHLAHHLLTQLLVPALIAGAPARVVSVASAGHHMSDVHWDDPNFERHPYDKWQAYGQSKTANILFAIELDRRLRDRGVRAFSVHPGAIRTGLSVHFTVEDRAAINATLERAEHMLEMKTIPQGAASAVWAATADLAGHGGAYIENCSISQPNDETAFSGQASWARDESAARRLWALSDSLIRAASRDDT